MYYVVMKSRTIKLVACQLLISLSCLTTVQVVGQGRSSSDSKGQRVILDHVVMEVDSIEFNQSVLDLEPVSSSLCKSSFTLTLHSSWITLSLDQHPIVIISNGLRSAVSFYFELDSSQKILNVEAEWNTRYSVDIPLRMAYKTFRNEMGMSSMINLLNLNTPYCREGLPPLNLWLFQSAGSSKEAANVQLLDWHLPVVHKRYSEKGLSHHLEAGIYANEVDKRYLLSSMLAIGLDSSNVSENQLRLFNSELLSSSLAFLKVYRDDLLIPQAAIATNFFKLSTEEDHYLIKFN